MLNVTENEEDCIYWFRIIDPRYGARLAESQYVNVSAPKAEETTTVTASMVLTTFTAETTTSTTDASSSKEAGSASETSSKSGLSRGEIAGVAVGATIGGLLILGVIGWVAWKGRMRRKNDAAPAELPDSYNQDRPYSERPKSELPAEPVVFSSESPRSPPIIYEAP
jgi:F0F1-type ATP synthase assembly protein I